MKRQEQIEKAATAKSRGETPYYYDAFIAGAEWADAHPCWISVEDKLPPLWQGVLAYNGVTIYIAWVSDDFVWRTYKEHCFRTYPVTHWMPRPSIEEIRGNQGKISPNQQQIIGTIDHIKTALDVIDKKGGDQ